MADDIVVEEPLEIRANGDSLGITMRTPGDDFDLAIGLLWTEGFITSVDEIGTIAYCPDEAEPALRNVVNVGLVESARRFESTRKTWANSSCGICGKSTIASIRSHTKPVQNSMTVSRNVLAELPHRLRSNQKNFSRTGGIHGAALFDPSGNLLLIREDIGRHNAVDKTLGAALRAGLRVGDTILMVSGRLGFEIAQKAAMARVPVVASVSAPSSLAVELANEFGVTTVGFLRDRSMNIYSHPERIVHVI